MMPKLFARSLTRALLTAACLLPAPAAVAQNTFITIGTGGLTDVYYPTGSAICGLVNRGRTSHGVRCGVEPSGGSVSNITAIREGTLDFGVAQSDWQYHAVNGSARFAGQGPMESLRAVFSVHPEPFTVVARADASISRFEDLNGKRVNVGNPGSGQRGTMEVLMAEMGWQMTDFATATELPAPEQASALCDDTIDAMIYTVGHPSGSIQEANAACDLVLVSVDNAATEALIAANPFYRKATIPGGMYPGTADDITTFGVGATLVTSTAMPEAVVYTLVKAVFDNLDQFRNQHPAFANLDPAQMVRDGLSAPLHPGAERYFREAGLID